MILMKTSLISIEIFSFLYISIYLKNLYTLYHFIILNINLIIFYYTKFKNNKIIKLFYYETKRKSNYIKTIFL